MQRTDVGATKDGPWFNGDGTYDLTKKETVDGAVTWPSEYKSVVSGNVRTISGNALPSTSTGVFPIDPATKAYTYDLNPNNISPVAFTLTVPANPVAAERASPVGLGRWR